MTAFLEWNAQWGDSLGMLQDMQDSTGIVPAALLNRPVLGPRLLFFYSEYLEVARSRTYSEGGGPYPLLWGPFMDYCQIHGIEHQDRAWLWDGIKLIDDVQVEITRKRMKSEIDAAKNK